MRMTRIMALLLAALVSIALIFTSEAATAHVRPAERTSFGTFNVKPTPAGTALIAHGNTIGWKHKPVLIQKKRESGGHWVTVARDRTDAQGNFRAKLTKRQIPCGPSWRIRAKKGKTSSVKEDNSTWSC